MGAVAQSPRAAPPLCRARVLCSVRREEPTSTVPTRTMSTEENEVRPKRPGPPGRLPLVGGPGGGAECVTRVSRRLVRRGGAARGAKVLGGSRLGRRR